MRDLFLLVQVDEDLTEMIKSSGGRVRLYQRKKELIETLTCEMVGAFNSLYGAMGPEVILGRLIASRN